MISRARPIARSGGFCFSSPQAHPALRL
jgi:hypothetical protein